MENFPFFHVNSSEHFCKLHAPKKLPKTDNSIDR